MLMLTGLLGLMGFGVVPSKESNRRIPLLDLSGRASAPISLGHAANRRTQAQASNRPTLYGMTQTAPWGYT